MLGADTSCRYINPNRPASREVETSPLGAPTDSAIRLITSRAGQTTDNFSEKLSEHLNPLARGANAARTGFNPESVS